MSPLDAARRLARMIPCDVAGRGICVFCLHDDRTEEPHDEVHKPDCPWLSIPKIAAALEAAERVVVAFEGDALEDPDVLETIRPLVAAMRDDPS